jgi:hypothetical protein
MADSTISSSVVRDRTRTAWTVLLSALGVFIALMIGIPIGVHQLIQRSTVEPQLTLQAVQGGIQVEFPDGTTRLLMAGQPPLRVTEGTTILHDAGGETLLAVNTADGTQALGTIQIYPETQLQITVARSPRYSASHQPHRLEVAMKTGRLRMLLARAAERPANFRVHTAQGQFLLGVGGSYTVEAAAEHSQVTVREGEALIYAPKGQLQVWDNERGIVGQDGLPTGPLPPERDLIVNGHFRLPLESGWQVRTQGSDPSQSAGSAEIISSAGQQAVRFFREGTGHAESGIYQLLNQNLRDYSRLELHLSGRIDAHSLGVCGVLGSECPLMVRIDYEDALGNPLQWLQGFYAWVDPAAQSPLLCETCPPPRQQHEQHLPGAQFFYDSPDLIATLSTDGRPPARSTSIAVYASGHSYDVQLFDIELLAGE